MKHILQACRAKAWSCFLSCLICGFLLSGLQASCAAAESADFGENINKICDRFVERIEAENGGQKCAVIVGSFFGAQTKKKTRESMRVERMFFQAMLRRYSSHSDRPLFRLRFKVPLVRMGRSSDEIVLPPQARMLQKYGCGVLITGIVDGSGRNLSVHAELVDIISGTLMDRSVTPGEIPGGEGALAQGSVAPTAGDGPGRGGLADKQVTTASPGGTPQEANLGATLSDGVSRNGRPSLAMTGTAAAAGAGAEAAATPTTTGRENGLQSPNHLALQGFSDNPLQNEAAAEPARKKDGKGPETADANVQANRPETQSEKAAFVPVGPLEKKSPPGDDASNLLAKPADTQTEDVPARHVKGQYGVITGANFRYEGEIRGGRRWGTGTLVFDNGDKYVGEWRDNMKHGEGTYFFANGDRYEGHWRNDRMNGRGIYYYKSGSRYKGSFRGGRRDGKGVFYFSNGDRWEGIYRDGQKDGPAVYIWAGGKSQSEQWKDGEQIQ